MATEKNGMMFVLSSPSGVGKTTLTKKIAKNNSNFVFNHEIVLFIKAMDGFFL